MGTCCEAFDKHWILFRSMWHLPQYSQGRTQGRPKCAKNVLKLRTLDFTAWITGKRLKIDGYMLRGVWQELNSLSIHVTFSAIVPGAYPGESKMWLKTLSRLRVLSKTSHSPPIYRYISVADPELYNGADGRGEGSGEGALPLLRKNWIFTSFGGFWCILRWLFTFMQKLVRSMGGRHPCPLDSPLLYLRNGWRQMGTCCKAFDKHWILFRSM